MAKEKTVKDKREELTEKILGTIRKAYGSEAAMRLGGAGVRSTSRGAIPTGIDPVDNFVLGTGGFPMGRVVELYADEGAGKTSLALAAVAGVQRMGGLAFVAETEHSLDPARARTLGADIDAVILLQPDTLEEVLGEFEHVLTTLPADMPALIMWDSVVATPTAAEVEGGTADDKARVAEFARIMGSKFKLLLPLLSRSSAAFVAINQVRYKIGVSFGNPETTPGGATLKFYSTQRVAIRGGQAVKEGTVQTGKDVLVKAVKNKLVPPFRECRARLDYAKGWDNRWSTINFAKDMEALPAESRVTDKVFAEAIGALEKLPVWWTGAPSSARDTDAEFHREGAKKKAAPQSPATAPAAPAEGGGVPE